MGVERIYLKVMNSTYDKYTANILVLGEKLKDFPLRSEERRGCPFSPLLFNIVLEVLAIGVSQEK